MAGRSNLNAEFRLLRRPALAGLLAMTKGRVQLRKSCNNNYKMAKIKNKNQKPLTLEMLADYNQEVLFPAMEERSVTKEDFGDFKTEMKDFKTEMKDFKEESLKNQDATLKKLDILIVEKEMREYQNKKEKKLWSIIIRSLKEHRILSSKEMEEIAKLEIF